MDLTVIGVVRESGSQLKPTKPCKTVPEQKFMDGAVHILLAIKYISG